MALIVLNIPLKPEPITDVISRSWPRSACPRLIISSPFFMVPFPYLEKVKESIPTCSFLAPFSIISVAVL